MVRMIKYRTRLTESKRVILEKEVSMNYPMLSRKITSPQDAVEIGREFLHIHEEPEEHLYMICMNTKNIVIGIFEISHGSVNASIATPREIFQKALLANAVSIILMHNHPSGDSTASKEDISMTQRTAEAGKIVCVELLDHIIIGDRYTSLKEQGYC